jgi:hypothetical protein
MFLSTKQAGSRGGNARARKLSPERRREIARKASRARKYRSLRLEDESMLSEFRSKYIWWEFDAGYAAWRERVIAQVMNLGTFEDAARLEESLGENALIQTLRHAQPGWFEARAWHYWHLRLELTHRGVPKLPARTFHRR